MIKTLLFDLDGTLLPVDTDLFLSRYLKLLSEKIIPWIQPKDFVRHLMETTYSMINKKDRDKTNSEIFWEDFPSKIPMNLRNLEHLFDEFYTRDFPRLSHIVNKTSLPAKIIETAHNKGYEIVIATNPVFPRMAILERLRWINAGDFPYKLITCYETMHFSKPYIEYYGEILEKIEKSPEECLMIGNDVEEDMVAGNLGIKTFLVTDHLLNRKNIEVDTDYNGSLKDLADFISNLEEVNNEYL